MIRRVFLANQAIAEGKAPQGDNPRPPRLIARSCCRWQKRAGVHRGVQARELMVNPARPSGCRLIFRTGAARRGRIGAFRAAMGFTTLKTPLPTRGTDPLVQQPLTFAASGGDCRRHSTTLAHHRTARIAPIRERARTGDLGSRRHLRPRRDVRIEAIKRRCDLQAGRSCRKIDRFAPTCRSKYPSGSAEGREVGMWRAVA